MLIDHTHLTTEKEENGTLPDGMYLCVIRVMAGDAVMDSYYQVKERFMGCFVFDEDPEEDGYNKIEIVGYAYLQPAIQAIENIIKTK